MASHEVTPEQDARWALSTARQERYNARLEVRRAEQRLLAADKRVRAALAKLAALGVKE